PILNARYALNAANARWGSLYDALYGTDALPETDGATRRGADGSAYNPLRGQRVIAYARDFLDRAAPLARGSHHQAACYRSRAGAMEFELQVELQDGSVTGLADAAQFVGYQGPADAPSSVLL